MFEDIPGYFFIGFMGIALLSVFYLPAYFLLRKRMPLSRQIAYFLFITCVLIILTATIFITVIWKLRHGEGLIASYRILNMIPFQFITEDWAMGTVLKYTQSFANILMFVPVGFILPVAFVNTRKFYKTTFCMAGFSFFIEFCQYFIGRSADIDDFILNTLGGMLGYFIFYNFSKLLKNKTFWNKLLDNERCVV